MAWSCLNRHFCKPTSLTPIPHLRLARAIRLRHLSRARLTAWFLTYRGLHSAAHSASDFSINCEHSRLASRATGLDAKLHFPRKTKAPVRTLACSLLFSSRSSRSSSMHSGRVCPVWSWVMCPQRRQGHKGMFYPANTSWAAPSHSRYANRAHRSTGSRPIGRRLALPSAHGVELEAPGLEED